MATKRQIKIVESFIKKETKRLLKEEVGITRLSSLLDGELSLFKGNLNNYSDRQSLIKKIDDRLQQTDGIELLTGTTFEKTYSK